MLSSTVLNSITKHSRQVFCQRNIGILAPMFKQASDPIQNLFVEKIREYRQKSGGGTKLVEPTPEIEKELKSELERVAKIYGGGGNIDLTKFPTFNFPDPQVDPIVENISESETNTCKKSGEDKTDKKK